MDSNGGFSKMLYTNPYTNHSENNFINRKEQTNDFFLLACGKKNRVYIVFKKQTIYEYYVWKLLILSLGYYNTTRLVQMNPTKLS